MRPWDRLVSSGTMSNRPDRCLTRLRKSGHFFISICSVTAIAGAGAAAAAPSLLAINTANDRNVSSNNTGGGGGSSSSIPPCNIRLLVGSILIPYLFLLVSLFRSVGLLAPSILSYSSSASCSCSGYFSSACFLSLSAPLGFESSGSFLNWSYPYCSSFSSSSFYSPQYSLQPYLLSIPSAPAPYPPFWRHLAASAAWLILISAFRRLVVCWPLWPAVGRVNWGRSYGTKTRCSRVVWNWALDGWSRFSLLLLLLLLCLPWRRARDRDMRTWLAGVALILVGRVKKSGRVSGTLGRCWCSKDILLSSGLLVLLAGPILLVTANGSVGLTPDSLNPWLSNDGGLILRPPGNATNWMRSDGICTPHPPVEACRSDRCPSEGGSVDSGDGSAYLSAFLQRESSRLNPVNTVERVKTNDKGNASQCLPYLQSGLQSECICSHGDGAKRIDTLRKYYLQHCYHYNLWHVLSNTMREGIARSRQQCYAYLDVITSLDQLAAGFICQFEDIIRRYDCAQSYSQKSSCHQCKIAYRQWVCSMVLPMWLDGERIKPCRSFCHEVERSCPYFLPAEKTGPGSQYAGEPSFLCIDPDVLETTNQSLNSAYSDHRCYRPCTLNYNLEPGVDPSQCIASLGDISGDQEQDQIDDDECQYPNETSSQSGVRCRSNSNYQSKNQVSSCARTPHLCFGWRWRTLVLPYVIVLTILRYSSSTSSSSSSPSSLFFLLIT